MCHTNGALISNDVSFVSSKVPILSCIVSVRTSGLKLSNFPRNRDTNSRLAELRPNVCENESFIVGCLSERFFGHGYEHEMLELRTQFP